MKANNEITALFAAVKNGDYDVMPILADAMEEYGNPHADFVRNIYLIGYVKWKLRGKAMRTFVDKLCRNICKEK